MGHAAYFRGSGGGVAGKMFEAKKRQSRPNVELEIRHHGRCMIQMELSECQKHTMYCTSANESGAVKPSEDKDTRGLQKNALAEDIPDQTRVASMRHKYVEGRLHEGR